MNEANIRLCKVCKIVRNRIQDGTFDGKNKRWRDEAGNLWNGNLCPRCELDRVRNKMKEKRSAPKES